MRKLLGLIFVVYSSMTSNIYAKQNKTWLYDVSCLQASATSQPNFISLVIQLYPQKDENSNSFIHPSEQALT